MTSHDALLVAYACFATLVATAIALLNSSRQKIVTFLMCLWVLAGTMLNGAEVFVISLGSDVGFDLQFTRVLMLFLAAYLLVRRFLWPLSRARMFTASHEKFLLVFYLVILLSLIVHLSDGLSLKELAVKYSGWLTFPAFYFLLKEVADEGMVKSIFLALVLVAVFSSIVGLVQFFVDSGFLRAGPGRPAFGDVLRSDGVFDAEYTQSYFLIPAMAVALVTARSRPVRVMLVSLFLVGILLTFHRMSWGIALLVLGAYFVLHARRRPGRLMIGALAIVPLTFVIINLPLVDIGFGLIADRLFADTVTGRVNLYEIAFQRVQDTWLFGIGSAKTGTYYLDMLMARDLGAIQTESGGIHNLFLNMAYFYGVPVTVAFVSFLVGCLRFYWQRIWKVGIFYFIPASAVLMFVLANMTNWFYMNMDVSLLIAILTGCAIAVHDKGLKIIEPVTPARIG